MENTVKERLIKFLKKEKILQREFTESIGVGVTYISSIRKSISPEKLSRISECYPELNIDWLMTGQGNMLKEDKVEEPMQSYSPVPSGDVFAYLREKDEEIRELRARIDTLVEEKHELEMLVAHLEKGQYANVAGGAVGDTTHTKVG